MDFLLGEEERMIKEAARDLAAKEFAPLAEKIDETSEFPHDSVKKLAELGFMGMNIPEKWGGPGLTNLAYVLAMEEISKACASTGVIMSVNNSLVCDPILKFGNDDQRERFLKPLATGKAIGAYCLSEPEAGSDAQNIRAHAVKQGDHYLLNGEKCFITNGQVAKYLIIYVKTDPEAGHRGISALLVDAESDGVTRGKKENTMGIRASSTCSISLVDVKVPVENLLGKEGEGFKIALNTLDGGRIGIAAQALGIGQAALDAATAYSQERTTFGKPIATLQAVQWMLADSATQMEAARLLTFKAAAVKDRGERFTFEAAMAKLFAGRAAVEVSDRAVQVHGGYGYVKEYGVERNYRDAKITEIYEGTSEIQRLVIARGVLG